MQRCLRLNRWPLCLLKELLLWQQQQHLGAHVILLMTLLRIPAMLRKYFLGILEISRQCTKLVTDVWLWPSAGQKGGSERGQEGV